jgi:hypothetical protein
LPYPCLIFYEVTPAKNRSWFCDPKMFWYHSVFGKRV